MNHSLWSLAMQIGLIECFNFSSQLFNKYVHYFFEQENLPNTAQCSPSHKMELTEGHLSATEKFRLSNYIMILTLWLWQNSTALRTCHSTFFTAFSSRPLGYLSNSSRTVWSTNSKTRKSRFLRRKTSIKLTRLSCRNCWKSTKQNSTLKDNKLSKIVKNITKTHIIYQTYFFLIVKLKTESIVFQTMIDLILAEFKYKLQHSLGDQKVETFTCYYWSLCTATIWPTIQTLETSEMKHFFSAKEKARANTVLKDSTFSFPVAVHN